MADRWLQLEVLRELDDANATYFALTLGECTSHHYLVSMHCLGTITDVHRFRKADSPRLSTWSLCRPNGEFTDGLPAPRRA